jgi:hypothetical protein
MEATKAPQNGEIRETTPTMTMLPQQMGIIKIVGYPEITHDFLACNKFKDRIAVRAE